MCDNELSDKYFNFVLDDDYSPLFNVSAVVVLINNLFEAKEFFIVELEREIKRWIIVVNAPSMLDLKAIDAIKKMTEHDNVESAMNKLKVLLEGVSFPDTACYHGVLEAGEIQDYLIHEKIDCSEMTQEYITYIKTNLISVQTDEKPKKLMNEILIKWIISGKGHLEYYFISNEDKISEKATLDIINGSYLRFVTLIIDNPEKVYQIDKNHRILCVLYSEDNPINISEICEAKKTGRLVLFITQNKDQTNKIIKMII